MAIGDCQVVFATHDFSSGGLFESFKSYRVVRRRCTDPGAVTEDGIVYGLSLTAVGGSGGDSEVGDSEVGVQSAHYGWIRELSRPALEAELTAGKLVVVTIVPYPSGKAYLRRWSRWSTSLGVQQSFWEGRGQWESR
ncbi:hypothetical protein P280DRAFT_552799 [Massarina eburnea CBS 473.64]|uniref:Uncharacterized protein n=1 Tax=Massarina eburnea CBS 473.64 TaxID=1395130 RepID=A0A6A6RQB5_9PLEO|nr:hypothetical protein P280DRAFT_552799 [Massarina eburnea CBS 473.64]